METREALKRLKNKSDREGAISRLNGAARYIRAYERLFRDEIEDRYQAKLVRRKLQRTVRSTLATDVITGRMTVLREMLENPESTSVMRALWLAPRRTGNRKLSKPQKANKGAPDKRDFRLAIARLLDVCESAFEDYQSGLNAGPLKWGEQEAVRKAKWVIIAAIVMCAFPEMLKPTADPKNAIRTVKEGYRLQLQDCAEQSKPILGETLRQMIRNIKDEQTNA
jgi:hypothetical protein